MRVIGVIQLIENARYLLIFWLIRRLKIISFNLNQSQVKSAKNRYILSKFPNTKLDRLNIKKPLNNIMIETINDSWCLLLKKIEKLFFMNIVSFIVSNLATIV